jgi:hypothetical protein
MTIEEITDRILGRLLVAVTTAVRATLQAELLAFQDTGGRRGCTEEPPRFPPVHQQAPRSGPRAVRASYPRLDFLGQPAHGARRNRPPPGEPPLTPEAPQRAARQPTHPHDFSCPQRGRHRR